MPAQSPTLSPTLSAITAGLRGSSSGMPGFDLAHQVGAHVGALGEDAAAQAREDRDQRGAEGEADQRLHDVCSSSFIRFGACGRAHAGTRKKPGNAEQAQADDQHAGDRAALEGDCRAPGRCRGARLRPCARWRAPTRSCRCSRRRPRRWRRWTKPSAVIQPETGTKPMHDGRGSRRRRRSSCTGDSGTPWRPSGSPRRSRACGRCRPAARDPLRCECAVQQAMAPQTSARDC